MTEREGEAAGHLYCNTPKCIVTGGQCIVTQYTVSELLFGHCSRDFLKFVFFEKSNKMR